MDAIDLLREARAAGLVVFADGERLVVRGPRLAEPIARRVLDHKVEVLQVLAPPTCEQCGAQLSHTVTTMLDVESLADTWRRAVQELGETADWPAVRLTGPRRIKAGAPAWHGFIGRASIVDLQLAVEGLRDHLAQARSTLGGN